MASHIPERTKVFISYSHQDKDWLKRLRTHLRPLERDYEISVWDDTQIKPGTVWNKEIQEAIHAAKVAVLLISADFLASDFIATDELPPLLRAAEDEGAIILPVILSDSRFLRTPALSRFQSVNDPSKPMINMTRGEQDAILVRVANIIEDTLIPIKNSATDPAKKPLSKLLIVCKEILDQSQQSLDENQKVLTTFFQNPAKRDAVYEDMVALYHNQRDRGAFGRWESFLESTLRRDETTSDIRDIATELLDIVHVLHTSFYSEEPFRNDFPNKISIKYALKKESGYDDQQTARAAETYLNFLRKLVERVGGILSRLEEKLGA